MLTDYELMASCLAGGLGVTRERLESTLGRLIRPSPLDAWDEAEKAAETLWSPLKCTALMQAMRDLTDIWQGFFNRLARFKEIEASLTTLKDNVLDGFGGNQRVLLDYYRLAQSLNDLKINSTDENSKYSGNVVF
ncbi:MAG: hypothetical protein LBR53_02215 [Deltaproteobacteria bacterium]|nr:hypothetical protein [Deltaproteobacteria bacterium]